MKRKWKHWTREETEYLQKNYSLVPIENIVEHLERDKYSIRRKASRLGLTSYIKHCLPWSEEEKSFMRENYGKMSNQELSDILGRSKDSINTLAWMNGVSDTSKRRRGWSDVDTETLTDNIDKSLDELCLLLPHKTRKQIKAKWLHLRFPKERVHRKHISKVIGRELDSSEHVHHINFDHFDNRVENMDIVDKYTHGDLHRQIFSLVPALMENGIIVYDRKEKEYSIKEFG